MGVSRLSQPLSGCGTVARFICLYLYLDETASTQEKSSGQTAKKKSTYGFHMTLSYLDLQSDWRVQFSPRVRRAGCDTDVRAGAAAAHDAILSPRQHARYDPKLRRQRRLQREDGPGTRPSRRGDDPKAGFGRSSLTFELDTFTF